MHRYTDLLTGALAAHVTSHVTGRRPAGPLAGHIINALNERADTADVCRQLTSVCRQLDVACQHSDTR